MFFVYRITDDLPPIKGDLGGSITEIADFNPPTPLIKGDMCLSYVLCLQNNG